MPFIHQHPGWPDFRWDDARLTSELASVRHSQGRLLGRMEGLGFSFRTEANVATLTADVVKSSAIEGEKLDPRQVRSSIARKLGLDIGGVASTSRTVDGIVEMLLDATRKYEAPLTSERLFGWQAGLFPSGRSGMRRITIGAWRPAEMGPMQVVSGAIGRERVHFEAPAAALLDREMTRFLGWFNRPLKTDPLIKAAIAHFWFVTIHPFEDGNGRIARAIADMALARADGCAERFYSMSAQIENERRQYYLILERCQRGDLDITPWMDWFLKCLGRAIAKAENSLASVLRKARIWERINCGPVNERQRAVVNRLLDDFKGVLNSSKYAKLAKCSTDTALRDLRELLERGILIRNEGGGRSTSYRLAEPQENE